MELSCSFGMKPRNRDEMTLGLETAEPVCKSPWIAWAAKLMDRLEPNRGLSQLPKTCLRKPSNCTYCTPQLPNAGPPDGKADVSMGCPTDMGSGFKRPARSL